MNFEQPALHIGGGGRADVHVQTKVRSWFRPLLLRCWVEEGKGVGVLLPTPLSFFAKNVGST